MLKNQDLIYFKGLLTNTTDKFEEILKRFKQRFSK